jgi:hypothetical protein
LGVARPAKRHRPAAKAHCVVEDELLKRRDLDPVGVEGRRADCDVEVRVGGDVVDDGRRFCPDGLVLVVEPGSVVHLGRGRGGQLQAEASEALANALACRSVEEFPHLRGARDGHRLWLPARTDVRRPSWSSSR